LGGGRREYACVFRARSQLCPCLCWRTQTNTPASPLPPPKKHPTTADRDLLHHCRGLRPHDLMHKGSRVQGRPRKVVWGGVWGTDANVSSHDPKPPEPLHTNDTLDATVPPEGYAPSRFFLLKPLHLKLLEKYDMIYVYAVTKRHQPERALDSLCVCNPPSAHGRHPPCAFQRGSLQRQPCFTPHRPGFLPPPLPLIVQSNPAPVLLSYTLCRWTRRHLYDGAKRLKTAPRNGLPGASSRCPAARMSQLLHHRLYSFFSHPAWRRRLNSHMH
jgi:hypothetical protein